ncbi:hypothetical protein GF323_03595 [Candidatus Woesearchaeota archaeon]|nr:hypothetical protein [Candidatus Woesearchaeota archaeon]
MFKNAPKDKIKALNFPKRIAFEEEIIEKCDGIVATSNKMRDYSMKNIT